MGRGNTNRATIAMNRFAICLLSFLCTNLTFLNAWQSTMARSCHPHLQQYLKARQPKPETHLTSNPHSISNIQTPPIVHTYLPCIVSSHQSSKNRNRVTLVYQPSPQQHQAKLASESEKRAPVTKQRHPQPTERRQIPKQETNLIEATPGLEGRHVRDVQGWHCLVG